MQTHGAGGCVEGFCSSDGSPAINGSAIVIVSAEASDDGTCAVIADRQIAMAITHAISAASGGLPAMCFLSETMRNVMGRSPIEVKVLVRVRGAMSQT
mgnify:CR=1 FL=1